METRFFIKAEDDPTKYLPFHTSYIDGKLIVTESFADKKIEKGAIVIAVNGVSSQELIRKLSDYRSGTQRESSYSAGEWLWIGAAELLGRPEDFIVSLAGGGKVTVKGMKLPQLQKRILAARASQTKPVPVAAIKGGGSPIELKFLDHETAYLNSTTFEYDLEKYKALLADAFRQIKSAGVRNLIIDVRKNGGGASQLGDALIDMFNAKPYRVWTSKWKRSVFYAELLKSGNIPIPASLIEKYLAARPGEVISGYSETVTPGGNPMRFDGRVYVLSGAKTFSSGVMFLGVIKNNKLAKIVGEETNAPACMFGEMGMFWLPHSRLRVSLSVRYWMPPAGSCNGTRGIVPDVVVRSSVNDFLTERDAILDTALGLIKQRR
jgi:hypothetical protein